MGLLQFIWKRAYNIAGVTGEHLFPLPHVSVRKDLHRSNTADFSSLLYSFLSSEKEGATRRVGDDHWYLHSLPPYWVELLNGKLMITGDLLPWLLYQISLRQQSWVSVLCLYCS